MCVLYCSSIWVTDSNLTADSDLKHNDHRHISNRPTRSNVAAGSEAMMSDATFQTVRTVGVNQIRWWAQSIGWSQSVFEFWIWLYSSYLLIFGNLWFSLRVPRGSVVWCRWHNAEFDPQNATFSKSWFVKQHAIPQTSAPGGIGTKTVGWSWRVVASTHLLRSSRKLKTHRTHGNCWLHSRVMSLFLTAHLTSSQEQTPAPTSFQTGQHAEPAAKRLKRWSENILSVSLEPTKVSFNAHTCHSHHMFAFWRHFQPLEMATVSDLL